MSSRDGDKWVGMPRLLLAGPFPEPVGGVSVHLSRLHAWLSALGIAVDQVDESRVKKTGVYNLRSFRVGSYLRYLTRCDVAHIHSSVHMFRILHILMCRMFGLRVVVTIHSWRPSRVATWINRLFLRLAHEVILVSEEINDYFQLRGHRVLPAFLPPSECRRSLPQEVQCFLDAARAQGRAVLCANAYELVKNQGEDLYGLDLCVELLHQLVHQSGVEASLVFIVCCDAKNNSLFMNAREAVAKYGLEGRVCLYNEPVDFIALLSQCNVVLRPTNTDGDALTIREALYYGVPVIASDVVKRPEGTILFQNRDVKDLVYRTIGVLENGDRCAQVPVQASYDSYFERYLNLYLGILRGRTGSGSPG